MAEFRVERETFVAFLLRAKRATYAAQGGANAKVPALLAGSQQLEYREGDLFYRDIYYGSLFFVGEEVVYFRESPFWVMNYGGGVTVDDVEAGAVGGFLQEAMRLVGADRPFRGPARYENSPYTYTDTGTGDLARFHGTELILINTRVIYELRYHGGLLAA